MQTSEGEAVTIARDLIRQHGTDAVHVAVQRLNEMIDKDDWRCRDLWARIVHAIHEMQGSSAETASPEKPTQ